MVATHAGLPRSSPCPCEIPITVDGTSRRRKVIWDVLGEDNWKFLGQGEFLDKDALFASMGFRLIILKAAAADAGEGRSRLPQQNTGGSDALCLGALPVSEVPQYEYGCSTDDLPSKSRINQEKNGETHVPDLLDSH